jgi:hypothetical protein
MEDEHSMKEIKLQALQARDTNGDNRHMYQQLLTLVESHNPYPTISPYLPPRSHHVVERRVFSLMSFDVCKNDSMIY